MHETLFDASTDIYEHFRDFRKDIMNRPTGWMVGSKSSMGWWY